MKNLLLIILIIFSNFIKCFPQGFERTLLPGFGYALCETPDHGFAICGSNTAHALLIKTDSVGNIMWDKSFGMGTGMNPEFSAYDLLLLEDGGFLLAGSGKPFTPHYYAYFIRTDSMGNELWHSEIASDVQPFLDDYSAYRIRRLSTGEFIAAGTVKFYSGGDNKICLIKIDAAGNLVWQKNIDPGLNEYFEDIIINDSIFAIVSTGSSGAGGYYSYLTITDTSGNLLNNYRYGTGLNTEGFTAIYADSVSGYHIAGQANYLSNRNVSLNNYSFTGDTISTYLIPSSMPNANLAPPFSITKDNELLVISGYEGFNGGNLDQAYIVGVDSSGNLQWRYFFGGTGYESFQNLIITNDSSYAMIGSATSWGGQKIYLVKTNKSYLLNNNLVLQENSMHAYYSSETNTLHVDNPLNQKYSLYVFDVSFKLVKKFENILYSNMPFSIDDGIYIYKIISKTDFITNKFIVNH